MSTAALSSAAHHEISRLRAGDHLCCIYRDRSEQMGIVVPYLMHGLQHNEKCIYIIDESTREDVFHAFGEAGVDLTTHSASGQFTLLTKEEAYLKEGRFDPDRMIATLKQAETDALHEGYAGLRVTGEMTWIFTRLPGVEKLIEYESKLNLLLPTSRTSAICQYREARFEPDILIDVIHTHPAVVIYGAVCENPYYIPPDVFLLRMKSDRIPLALYQKVRDDILARAGLKVDRRRLEAELKASLDRSERSRRAMLSTLEDQKRTADALRRVAARNQALLGSIPDIITEVDNEKIIRWTNPAGFRFFGEDVIGRPAKHYFEGEQDTYDTVQPLFYGDENTIYVESWQRRQDGEKRLLGWWCRVLKDAQGNVTGALSTARDITARKQAEDALKQEQVLSNAIINSIPGAFYMLDENGCYARWNTYQRDVIIGKPEELVAGTSAADTIHPDDRPLLQSRIADVLGGDTGEAVEGRVLMRGGPAFRWFLMTGRQMTLKGRPFLVGIGIDITARKQAAEALRESEDKYRNLIEATRTGFLVLDGQGRVVDANAEYVRLSGHRELGEIRGRCVTEWTAAHSREKNVAAVARCLREGIVQGVEIDYTGVEGRITPIEINATVAGTGADVRILSLCRDITARKRAAEALSVERQQLRTLIDNLPDLIYVKDAASRFTVANEALARISGATAPTLLLGHTDRDFFPADMAGLYLADEQRVLRDGVSILNKEEQVRMADGSLGWMSTTKIPLRDAAGGVIGLVGIGRDITAHKQAEEELQHVLSSARCILWHAVVTAGAAGGFDWQLRLSNEAAAEALLPLAREPGQAYSDAWRNNKPWEDIERMNRTSEQALRAGKPGYTQEFRCRTLNGEIRWLSEDARIQALGPDRWLVVGVCTDITARRDAAQQMQQQLDELRRWQAVTLGREGRIGELKREVNALATRLGQPPPYGTQEK